MSQYGVCIVCCAERDYVSLCTAHSFRPGVLEALDLVGCYVLLVDSWLPTLWDSLLSRLQNGEAWPLKMGPTTNERCVTYQKIEALSYCFPKKNQPTGVCN